MIVELVQEKFCKHDMKDQYAKKNFKVIFYLFYVYIWSFFNQTMQFLPQSIWWWDSNPR